MADYYTQFSVALPVGAENVQAALDLLSKLRGEAEETSFSGGDVDSYFNFAARASTDGQFVWIEDDGSNDTEGVILYARACAKQFSMKGKWGFTFAFTCSEPRLDAFGGGYVVIDFDKDSVEAHDVAEQLSNALRT